MRSIDEVDGACAAWPACEACRFRASLHANLEYTDEAEALRPTPPNRPFTRGGKVSATAACAQQNRSSGSRLFNPVSPNFAPHQPRPPGFTRSHVASTVHGRRSPAAQPRLETLESRVNLSTFIWTALGDGQTWNDANNWYEIGVSNPLEPPTVPTPYSDVIFPPLTTLPATSSTTIDCNFAYLYMPLNSLTIDDPYTFTGNPITIEWSLSTANSFSPTPGATPAVITLAGLRLAPGAVINTATGSSLQLGSTTSSTALQLTVQGPLTKSGGGQLAIDTESVYYANSTTVQPIPLTIADGSITLGDTVNLSGVNVQINSSASLLIADDVAAKVQGLTGTGLVDLEGTTSAGDSTSLSVAVPNATTDQFGGFIDGIGQFIAGGNGTLSIGTIDFGGDGSIQVLSGTLDVDGPRDKGKIAVDDSAAIASGLFERRTGRDQMARHIGASAQDLRDNWIGPLTQGRRRVTSGAGGGEPHRRKMISLTIRMLSAITSIVVTMLR